MKKEKEEKPGKPLVAKKPISFQKYKEVLLGEEDPHKHSQKRFARPRHSWQPQHSFQQL